MSEVATGPDWLRLDNAAKIYPASHTEASPAVFRVSVTLDSPIHYSNLSEALSRLMRRCAYYQVHLKRGFFWYYLQRHVRVPPIKLLNESTISRIDLRRSSEHLINVLVRDSTIAVDISHILTDGYGGIRFITSLAAEYLRLQGKDIPTSDQLLDLQADPDEQESEDAYRKHYRKGTRKPESLRPAYHLPGTARSARFSTIIGAMPIDEALAFAKAKGVKLTEYLAAVYIDSIGKIWHASRNKPLSLSQTRSLVRIEVPVNMRRHYPSSTMRNFSLFVSPEVDFGLGDYSFDEILTIVHHTMNLQLDRKQLDRQLARNVSGELNPMVRATPLILKDLVLAYIHNKLGDNAYSGVISNLGPFQVPPAMEPHVRSVGFFLGPNERMKTGCTVISYGGKLQITFIRVIGERELERLFFKRLVRDGLSVVVSESGT